MVWIDCLVALGVLVFVTLVATRSFARFQPSAEPTSGASALLGARIRSWYVSFLVPIEERCLAFGIHPTHLSFAQLFLSAIVAVVFAMGMLFTGGWLLLVTGSLDIVDGRLARRTNSASLRGAFLDSVVDRYADSLGFVGLAVYFRESMLLWVVLFALVGSLLVSYTRARAEGLGQSCRVGLLQRPERYVLLGFGCMASVVFARLIEPVLSVADWSLLALVLAVLAVLINATAVQRALYVWRALSEREEARHAS